MIYLVKCLYEYFVIIYVTIYFFWMYLTFIYLFSHFSYSKKVTEEYLHYYARKAFHHEIWGWFKFPNMPELKIPIKPRVWDIYEGLWSNLSLSTNVYSIKSSEAFYADGWCTYILHTLSRCPNYRSSKRPELKL